VPLAFNNSSRLSSTAFKIGGELHFMNELTHWLGLVAGTFTTAAFVPQVIKPQSVHPCTAALA
jgi:hypothetical protein